MKPKKDRLHDLDSCNDHLKKLLEKNSTESKETVEVENFNFKQKVIETLKKTGRLKGLNVDLTEFS